MMERSGMEESKGTKGRGCLDVADKRSRQRSLWFRGRITGPLHKFQRGGYNVKLIHWLFQLGWWERIGGFGWEQVVEGEKKRKGKRGRGQGSEKQPGNSKFSLQRYQHTSIQNELLAGSANPLWVGIFGTASYNRLSAPSYVRCIPQEAALYPAYFIPPRCSLQRAFVRDAQRRKIVALCETRHQKSFVSSCLILRDKTKNFPSLFQQLESGENYSGQNILVERYITILENLRIFLTNENPIR